MALKYITAEEAASFIKHGDRVGFSGFTHAGCQSKNMKREILSRLGFLPEHRQETVWMALWPVLKR